MPSAPELGTPFCGVHRVADLQLRGSDGPLRARVCWPLRGHDGRPGALLVFLRDAGATHGSVDGAEAFCRGLCARTGVVVLSASAAFDDAAATLEWAADHAAELDADPRRLIVAGERAAGALAAALALHARDHAWPALIRQVLIHPDLEAGGSPLRAESVAGVAPATIVTAGNGPRGDGASLYAARLRAAGVAVEELHHEDPGHSALSPFAPLGAAERMLADLARSLRGTIAAPVSPERPVAGTGRGASDPIRGLQARRAS
jgi:acetyl esterase